MDPSMAALESTEVDGTEELRSSLADVSLDDDEELLCRTLEYDLSMRLIVAHEIQTLKLDLKKRIDMYGSLLLDLDGEADRMRHRVAASWAARELDAGPSPEILGPGAESFTPADLGAPKFWGPCATAQLARPRRRPWLDADAENVGGGPKDDDDEEEDEEEEEETTVALREFRDMYIKASGVDDRLKEFYEMVWVHYDPDLDNETRKATVARLWRHIEKELDDRADVVTSGEFRYTYAPLPPRQQSQSS
ncbi:unnamed protein product [Alopecurus aequalis]